jgi:hypothetical protein
MSTWQHKFFVVIAEIEEEASISSSLRHEQVFWRRCREKRRLLQGEFRTHILYFVLSFAFTLFLVASFYQKHKKLVSLVVIFTCLLLVC